MNASRSPFTGWITGPDARRASFGFELRQEIDNNAEKRQAGEVDRSSYGRVYFRTNFAITTAVRKGSAAEIIPRTRRPPQFGQKETLGLS